MVRRDEPRADWLLSERAAFFVQLAHARKLSAVLLVFFVRHEALQTYS